MKARNNLEEINFLFSHYKLDTALRNAIPIINALIDTAARIGGDKGAPLDRTSVIFSLVRNQNYEIDGRLTGNYQAIRAIELWLKPPSGKALSADDVIRDKIEAMTPNWADVAPPPIDCSEDCSALTAKEVFLELARSLEAGNERAQSPT